MSGCERALDLIGLRLDGPLSPEEQRELDAHLEQCPACRAAARELREKIPNARLAVIPGAGHEVNVDQPAVLGAELARFFGEGC